MENTFVELSKTGDKPALIVCDRGAIDIAAYFDDETWASLISELSFTKEQLSNDRYDAIIHLVTVANGAESFIQILAIKLELKAPKKQEQKIKD